jgi:uncharacterized protein (TIRG00374 family)
MLLIQPLVLLSLAVVGIRLIALMGKPAPQFRHTFKAILLAYGLNNILPGRMGELAKISYLYESAQVPIAVGMAAILLERFMDVIFLGVLVMLGIWIFLKGTIPYSLLTLAMAFSVFLFFLVKNKKLLMRIVSKIPWKIMRQGLEDILKSMADRLKERALLKALFFGLTAWTLSYLTFALFLQINGANEIGFLGALAVFTGTTIGVAIPGAPGGIGTYEAGAVFALQRLGYGIEEALAIGITLHFSQILIPLTGSIFIILTEKIGVISLAKQTLIHKKSGFIDGLR